ncbi:expressed protein [Phakopsora pachyrhizi]|uniref:Expressed protein n=1 Tax=Phakopsora pachyrhizi TaxID=170000 RepID=A0AAV0AHX7_PHAPC|nr:expressed protein [Phakopsora pachyrhizi]
MNQLKSNDINKIYHPNLSEQLQYLLQKFSTLDPTTNKVKNKEITDYKHRNNSEKKLYEGYVQNSPEAKDDESWYSWMMASFVGKRQKNDLENTEHAKKDSKIKLRATRFLDNKSNFYNLSKKIFYYRNKFPIRLKFLSKPQVYSLAKIRFERFNSYFSYCEKIFKQKFLGYERSVEQELGQSPIESGIKTISNYLFYTKRSLEESSIDSLAKFDQARKSSQSNIEITQNQLSRYKLISIRNYDLKTKKVPFISGYEHSTVVRGDGNCQFRAISLLIYGTQDYHEDVRRNVIKILRAEKDFYKEFVQERTGNEIGQAGDPFEAYVTLMSRVGEWGDQLTLKASSKAFNLEIVVLELSEGRLFLTEYLNENKNSRMPLPFGGIFFSRDHYEVLIKT